MLELATSGPSGRVSPRQIVPARRTESRRAETSTPQTHTSHPDLRERLFAPRASVNPLRGSGLRPLTDARGAQGCSWVGVGETGRQIGLPAPTTWDEPQSPSLPRAHRLGRGGGAWRVGNSRPAAVTVGERRSVIWVSTAAPYRRKATLPRGRRKTTHPTSARFSAPGRRPSTPSGSALRALTAAVPAQFCS
jgi:hypothetical protein